LRAGQVGGCSRRVDVDAVEFLADSGDGQGDGAVRDVDDHVDGVALDPLAGQGGADVGLVLVVAENDLDRDVAAGGVAVGDAQLDAFDGDRAAQVAVDAGFVA
jgi:hypothetical protein